MPELIGPLKPAAFPYPRLVRKRTDFGRWLDNNEPANEAAPSDIRVIPMLDLYDEILLGRARAAMEAAKKLTSRASPTAPAHATQHYQYEFAFMTEFVVRALV